MMTQQVSEFDAEWAARPQWAAMYRRLGVQVVPSYAPSEATNWKRPALADWRIFQEELAPDAVFERWYGQHGEHTQRSNMGILTGPASGGIFVIDLDDYKNQGARGWWDSLLAVHNNGMPPETWAQTTGGGGRQIFFRAPPHWRPPTNRTPIGVDIRGHGGFAVLPPSLHSSGLEYEWQPGSEPWAAEIAEAPEWLTEEIDRLVARFVGDLSTERLDGTEITVSPGHDFDAFGGRVDGREDYMRRLVWACVLDMYRESPIKPPEAEIREAMERAYEAYEHNVRTRLSATENKTQALEREGRGPTEFKSKFRKALAQWDTKVAAAARLPSPRPAQTVAKAQTFIGADTLKGPANDPWSPPPVGDTFEYLSITQIKEMPDPKWLVDGLVVEHALGFIVGPPGCCKTFIALGLGLSFATQREEWWGKPIQRHGAVVYISSEGQSDLKFRIKAWEKHNGTQADGSPFYLIRQTINFMRAEDIGKLLKTVDAIAKVAGVPIAAVFVDTVSRVLPGADENLQKDMTLFIAACDAVRQQFGATVIGVHHTARGGNMRGSTVFPGAADFILEVEREAGAEEGKVFASKIKAAEDGWEIPFKVRKQSVSDITGQESLVVEPDGCEAPKAKEPPKAKLSDTAIIGLQALRKAIEDEGKPVVSDHIPQGVPCVDHELWRRYFYTMQGEKDGGVARVNFNRAKTALMKSVTIEIWGQNVWISNA